MSRLRSPDQIKAVSIFGVVFIHAAYLLGQDDLTLQVARNLFRFDVPCFMMLWAFFFERSYGRRAPAARRAYTWDRFRDLFGDYFWWSLLYFLVLANWAALTLPEVLTRHFAGYGWSGQYFFIALFQLLFLFPLIRYAYDLRWLRYLVIGLSCVMLLLWGYAFDDLPVVLQKLGERPFFLWVPTTFAGIALARGDWPRIPAWAWVTVVFIPLEFYLLDVAGRTHQSHATPVVMLSSILLFVSVVQRDIWFRGPRVERVGTFLGSRTLIVFLANPLIIHLLEPYLPPVLAGVEHPALLLLIQVVIALAIIGVCLLLGRIKNTVKGLTTARGNLQAD